MTARRRSPLLSAASLLRLRRLVPLPIALAASPALAAAPAAAAVTVSANPALRPASFQRSLTDYVSRCVPGKPLVLTINATGGEKVAIGSGKPKSGKFTASLNRKAGGGVTLRISSPTKPGTYHIRCLPTDFPRWGAKRPGTPQAQWYVVTPNGTLQKGYLAIFDSHAVPVWWRRAAAYGPWDAKLMPDRTIAWTHYEGNPFGFPGAYGYELHRFDGSFVKRVQAFGTPTDTHELTQRPNGNYLVISYEPRTGVDLTAYGGPANAKVYDGAIQELDPSGKVVWEWHSQDHVALSETGRWWPKLVSDQNNRPAAERFYDLVHLNSIEPDGDGFIVSARHLDAVFRINRATKQIDWKLGGVNRPGESLLLAGGDPYGDQPFGGQHDAHLYKDGTLTVYDNETLKDRAPRAVRYSVDPLKHTATFVEAHGDSRATVSNFAGSARKLPGGNWVVYWGGSTLVSEQTDKGKPVFSISFRDNRWGYRAVPIVPGQVSAKTLRSGMDTMSK